MFIVVDHESGFMFAVTQKLVPCSHLLTGRGPPVLRAQDHSGDGLRALQAIVDWTVCRESPGRDQSRGGQV